jgi:2-phosphosulfolactate phosphatase
MPAPDLPPPPQRSAPTRPVAVHLLPRWVEPESLRGSIVLMIDNLRASITIAQALESGATRVIPCLTVDDARTRAAQLRAALPARAAPPAQAGAPVLLAGERAGTLIPGFDLDNSPLNFTPQRVAGSTIVFTTTNGTAALLHAHAAARTLVASLANLDATCALVGADPRPVHILCAGTRDLVSMDDALAAGALVDAVLRAGRELIDDDTARLCLSAWREASRTPDALHRAIRESLGGRNLLARGFDADVAFCSRLNTLRTVPEFDRAAHELVVAR